MFRILRRDTEKERLDTQLHVLVNRATVSSSNSSSSTPLAELPIHATHKANIGNATSRIDETMHVLKPKERPQETKDSSETQRPKPYTRTARPTRSTPTLPTPATRCPPTAAPTSIRTSALPDKRRSLFDPNSSTSSFTSSFTSSSSHKRSTSAIPSDAPPAIIAGCIADVLSEDSHAVLASLEPPTPKRHRRQSSLVSLPLPPPPPSSLLPRLAIRAKGLLDDNRRLETELAARSARVAELEEQLFRMEDLKRSKARPRTQPVLPPTDTTDTKKESSGLGLGLHPHRSTSPSMSSPIPRSPPQWFLPLRDEAEGERTPSGDRPILPPPRRGSRAGRTSSPVDRDPDGVSLKRFCIHGKADRVLVTELDERRAVTSSTPTAEAEAGEDVFVALEDALASLEIEPEGYPWW